MVREVSRYEPPEEVPHRQLVVTIESSEGSILLRPNKAGQGYKLLLGTEGLGAGSVENEITPRLGERGATLGNQRETEADIHLPILIMTTGSAEVRRLVSELRKVLKLADGTVQLKVEDPATGESRFREVAYRDGLSTPLRSSPSSAVFGLTLDYLDPWAYSSDEETLKLLVAPGASGGLTVPVEIPVAFARSGAVRDRYAINTGEKPAPVTLRFYGPMKDPEAKIPGLWTFGIDGTLEWDEYLRIDGKARTARIFSRSGSKTRSAYSWIRRGSRFTDLVLPPGRNTMQFRGLDDTYTAYLTARWHNTYQAMY